MTMLEEAGMVIKRVSGVLRRPFPGIADVQCSRLRFEPGDRLLVRSVSRLDSEQQKKLRKSICKWAGCEVEVLFVCLLDYDVKKIEKAGPVLAE